MAWTDNALVCCWWTIVLLLVTGHGVSGRTQADILEDAVITAVHKSIKLVEEERALDISLFKAGIDEKKRSSDSRHMFGNFRFLKDRTTMDSRMAAIAVTAATTLSNMLGKNVHELRSNPVIRKTWMTKSPAFCRRRRVDCRPSPYRTTDGSCNNLEFPTWGMSDRGQNRYLPSVYSDGISHPRKYSVSGKPLPSPRVISNAIHRTGGRSGLLEPTFSVMVMQWGQLLDHDFIDTPMMKGQQNTDMECCNIDPALRMRRSGCFVIPIPPHDPRFAKPCMNFVRSAPAARERCDIGQREQLNQATSYIDASYIYGTDMESMAGLRRFKHGYLKMNKRGLFTPSADKDQCTRELPMDYCMKSGDKRLHVVPGLASTQILMLREHNRIATILGRVNPHWNDERIFQETRKIIAAFNQHITYVEYLPKILTPHHMQKFGLRSTRRGYNTVYNPTVDSTVVNSFGVAAFRFGHSQIPENVDLLYRGGKRHTLPVEDTFNRPSTVIEDGGVDAVNRAMAKDRTANTDRLLENGVLDDLFLDDKGESFDLSSLNIQRGRDHGVPGYNEWRKWCGLPPAFHFRHAPGGLVDIDPESADILSHVYRHPDDIDLFTGGLSEIFIKGGELGPTFACIIGRQFRDLKVGDRFWYENDFRDTGFTRGQLDEIKGMRLSKIMCNNMGDEFMAEDVFQIPSKRNPEVPCKLLRDINYNFWKEIVPSTMKRFPTAPLTVLSPLKYW